MTHHTIEAPQVLVETGLIDEVEKEFGNWFYWGYIPFIKKMADNSLTFKVLQYVAEQSDWTNVFVLGLVEKLQDRSVTKEQFLAIYQQDEYAFAGGRSSFMILLAKKLINPIDTEKVLEVYKSPASKKRRAITGRIYADLRVALK